MIGIADSFVIARKAPFLSGKRKGWLAQR